jgi:hypothetical protein
MSVRSRAVLCRIQGKGKVQPGTGNEEPEREFTYIFTLSLTSAIDGVSVQRHVPAALTPGKKPGTHFTGGWVGPRAGVGVCRKSHPSPGFDPRTVQQEGVAIPTELSRPTK